MKTCKDCGTEVSKSAKTCPKCGAKLKGGIGKVILIILAIIVVFGVAAGATGGNKSDSANINSSQSSSSTTATDEHANDQAYQISKKFETVSEPEMTIEYGYPKINGSLKNISGKNLSYAQIQFSLYDEDGAQIGSAWTNINNLDADGVWKYEATGFDEGAVSFKMADIDAW